jgi:hypothetical protein
LNRERRSIGRETWRDLHPRACAPWFSALTAPWWIAGGWALDLFAGAQSRPHADLDLGILRRDTRAVLEALPSWEVFEADAGVLVRLGAGRMPRERVNSLWCRQSGDAAWSFELLLDESAGDFWIFRREREIRAPLEKIIRRSAEGLPYLAPEIQLLYKARDRRPRDDADFERIAPRIDRDARAWLARALARVDPGHPWLQVLDELSA